MNEETLQNAITAYKKDFQRIKDDEIYKWHAIKRFQLKWDLDADDLSKMIGDALDGASNLLGGQNYFPRDVLKSIAKEEPETFISMFTKLFDEDSDLIQRIESFRGTSKEWLNKTYGTKYKNTYQDDRAIMVYLTMKYPDRYYFYKYQMFMDAAEKVEYEELPRQGKEKKYNIARFDNFCERILDNIEDDKEILELDKSRHDETTCTDEEHHLLVQDIIYFIARCYDEEKAEIEFETVTPTEFTKKAYAIPVKLNGEKIKFQELEKKNKKIGDAGEEFIVLYEIDKLKKLGIEKKVEHVSYSKGDGLGYDILSYDKNGEKIYIEVKTTEGPEDCTFFITENERIQSENSTDKYFLYRVYDFNMKLKTGKIAIKHGSLSNLCIQPI